MSTDQTPPLRVPALTNEQRAAVESAVTEMMRQWAEILDQVRPMIEAMAAQMVQASRAMADFVAAYEEARQAAARPAWVSPYGPPPRRR
ncbi:hypothetical protein [Kitasatospora sp. LaBMicrA B282]|uniref:hypothetical protein n=1 Tax=Kitasatospora sp. LaBMicrA B282 TaxID=3420949 RepID=UPI003D144963